MTAQKSQPEYNLHLKHVTSWRQHDATDTHYKFAFYFSRLNTGQLQHLHTHTSIYKALCCSTNGFMKCKMDFQIQTQHQGDSHATTDKINCIVHSLWVDKS